MSATSAIIPSFNGPGLGADQLLNTLPWGLLEVSVTGSIRYLNRQAAIWWGVPAETALGQTIDQVGPGQLSAPAYSALGQAASESTAAIACYLSQTEQWVTLTSAKQPTGELVVYWQDTTTQKQREQQYQTLAENTPDVLTRWDPALRLLYANAAFAAKAGQPLSALLGRPFANMGLPAEVTGPYQAVLQRVFATGQPQEHYNTFPGPHGPIHYHSRLVPELRDGRIETVLGIARDISELKRTEAETLRLRDALGQQATDRYQALLYAMDEGFCVIELTFDAGGQQVVDYVYRELNPVFAQQSGLPAEALGQSVRALVPDLEPLWFDLYGQVARTGEPVRLEHQVPQLSRWFEMHACRVGGPGSRQVAVLFNDITGRKQTEEQLRRAAEANAFRLHLADALGPLTNAVAIQEVVTHLARLYFAADRCYYCEIEDGQALIRRDAASAGLPSVAGTYPLADFALLEAVIAAGRPFIVPDVRQDESVDENLRQLCVQLHVISYLDVPVVKNGATVGVLCLVQSTPRQWTAADAHLAAEVAERTWTAVERARAEETLATSEARFRAVANLVPDLLWRSDPDSETTWYNERWYEYTGQTPTDAAGYGWTDVVHPDDRAESSRRYQAAIAAGQPLRQEHRIRSAEGTYRWFQMQARPLRNGHEEVITWFGAATDIHARKQAEQRQEFLLQLSDTLRAETGVAAVGNRAVQLIAEQLGADRVYLVTLTADDDTVVITHETRRADLPPLQGSYRSSDFPSAIKELFAHTIVYNDVRTDARLTELERLSFAGLSAVGFIAAPIRRGSEAMIWAAGALSTQPRAWTAPEIALFEDAVERTWAAVERARAEEALRESEAKHRTLFETMGQGYGEVELVRDADGRAVDHRYIELNPAYERLVGILAAQAKGRLASEVIPGLELSVHETFGRIARGGVPEQYEVAVGPLDSWFSVFAYPQKGDRLILLYEDVTERKRREANLAFLAGVNQDLARLSNIDETMQMLGTKIGFHFGVSNVAFGEVDEPHEVMTVAHEWRAADALSFIGEYRISDFLDDDLRHTMRAGAVWVMNDVQNDTRANAENIASLGIGAMASVPFARGGEWLFNLTLYSREARHWRDDEIELLSETATRIWTRLERARAEQALRRREDIYRTLFDSIDEGYCLIEVLLDDNGRPADVLHLEVNQAHQRKSGLGNIVGQRLLDFMPEVEPEWLDFYGNVALTGQPARLEYQVAALGRWFTSHATRVGGEGSRLVAIVFDDITARKHHEQRQQFLLQLSDRLRPLADPLAVQQAALHWVGEQLGLDRLLFNEIDPAVTTYTVRASYVREGFLAYGGQQPLGPFTESVRALQQGITKVVYDVETDESFSAEEKVICASIQVRAFVTVPLVKDGRWLVNLVAHASQPRPWPPHEIALLEETAERTWAAVERAKVEEALRESEAQLRSFVTASSDTLYRMSADWQQMHSLQSKDDFMTPTTAPNETWLTRYIPPADQPAVQVAIQAAIAGRHFFELEHHVFRADGSVGWTFSRAVPVLDAQRELVEWFGTATDITARKTAEEALWRSEERLRLALDAAELGTWDWSIAANEVRWNNRHFTMLGLAPQPGPVTPDDFIQAVHPDDRPRVLERLRAAVADNHLFEAEFRIVTPQEDVRWMSGHGQPTDIAPNGRVQRMTGVMLDVTERKYAEQHLQALAASLERKVARRTQALQESQQLLQSVYDTTLIGLAALHAVRDEATGAITDFTFVSANKELARLSGRPNLAGRRYGSEFPGLETSGVLALMAQAVDTGRPQQTEFSYSVAGITRWVAFMCVKLDGGVVATLLDITERKHIEQQLTRNLRLLEQAETVAQLGIWDYDLATGQFYWSGGMYNLFGLPLGQPVQPPIYLDYVLAEDRPQAEQLVRQMTTGASDLKTTLRLRVGEQVKTVRIKAVVLHDAAGQPVRVLGVDLDISEVQRLEADNLRLRLRQQQALFEAVQEAQEEERRRISESLHNGLSQVLYATKLQLDRLPDVPTQPARYEAARLLSDAIRQTRAISHELSPATLEDFGLEVALRSICRTLNSPDLQWHCYLMLEESLPLPRPLQITVYRLAQELAQNVVKHAQARHATLEVEVLPEWVVLRLEDDGRGFDPATTSDGLGLRTLRSRVALLGGVLQLTTGVGHGTYCLVRLPLPVPAS